MQIQVNEISAVGEARRVATELARTLGFDEEDRGKAALIASELTTNLLKHAGSGTIHIKQFDDNDGTGLELLALDRGPGMASLERCMQDGYSTAGSKGNGLGAIFRIADRFDYYTALGSGTVILARLFATRKISQSLDHNQAIEIGALTVCYPGELECGDVWRVNAKNTTVFVADGLGHGHNAAIASELAGDIFTNYHDEECKALMERIHRALLPTRGAATAMARVDMQQQLVRYVGIGNIAGTLISDGTAKKMISRNGITGHKAPTIVEFTYPFEHSPLVILHSDGLSSRWDLAQYPGLIACHPSVIVGVLFRDHRRPNDDATIVAMRVL